MIDSQTASSRMCRAAAGLLLLLRWQLCVLLGWVRSTEHGEGINELMFL